MVRTLIPVAGLLSLLLLIPGEVSAHGGDYRGPGGQVPPRGAVPGDPSPPSTGPTTTPDGTGGPGQTTPGPITTLGGPGSGPTAPAGRGPRGYTNSPGRQRKSSAEGFERWEFWWGYNRVPFLELKNRIHRIGESTDSLIYYLGRADKNNIKDTTLATESLLSQKIIPSLTKAMDDSFFDVRAAAVIALGKTGSKKEIPSILKGLQDESKQVRESSALALGILSEPESVDHLVSILNDTPEGKKLLGRGNILNRTRAFSAIALGLIGRESEKGRKAVIPHLFAALMRNEPQRDVPVCVVTALGISKAKEAVHRLVEVVKDYGTDSLLRAHAIVALGRIGDTSVIPILQKCLRDKHTEVRRSAVLALGILTEDTDPASITYLRNEVENGRDSQTKNWAMIALGKIGGPEARQILLRSFDRQQKSSKAFAALALAIHGRNRKNSEDGKYIHQAFSKMKGDSARAGLAIAMGLMNYQPAKRDLTDLMSGKGDPDLRGYCAVALGLLNAHEAIPQIKKALSLRIDPDFQRSAATALGLMGDRSVVDQLTRIIRTAKTEYEISSATLALGLIGDISAVDPLIDTMEDKVDVVDLARANATTALGIVGDRRSLPALHVVAVDCNYRSLVDSLSELLSIL